MRDASEDCLLVPLHDQGDEEMLPPLPPIPPVAPVESPEDETLAPLDGLPTGSEDDGANRNVAAAPGTNDQGEEEVLADAGVRCSIRVQAEPARYADEFHGEVRS
jgi:hypothetical protein